MTLRILGLSFSALKSKAKPNKLSLQSIGLITLGFLLGGLGSFDVCTADENSILEHLSVSESTSYLQQGDFRLERVETKDQAPLGSITFQKLIKDIPLHGARVVVFEERDGSVAQVFDDSSKQLNLIPRKPALEAQAAIEQVEEVVANAIASTSELVWFRIGNEAVLAWEITTTLLDNGEPVSPTGLETVVDASTGAILSQRQLDTKTYQPGSPEVADSVFPRIVINNAIGAAGSRAYAAPFDAVVEVDFGCTGTLIAPNVVLCARHCGVGAGDTIIFGDNANGGGIFSRTVQSSSLPDGNGSLLDGGDVAILTLTQTVPANIATPMRLIDETDALEGMVCATVGYGFNGLGSAGHQFSADGFRWGGENIIDVYGSPSSAGGSNIISTDFDNGQAGNNEIPGSSPTPLEFEATTAPGDSGGPVLVQIGSEWVIAGVLSGGTTNTSVFGDISWWTGTAIYRSAIENAGGVFAGDIEITLPNGIPDFVSPVGGDTLAVDVIPIEGDAIVSGTFHVDLGTGFQSFPLTENSETSYSAVFPASECMTAIQFYVSFELDSGTTVTYPEDAPANSFSVLSALDLVSLFDDSFESNLGWTVTGPAVEGRWQRAIPNNGDRGDPEVDADASGNGFCYVTDNNNAGSTNSDVDDGETVLTSPVMSAVGAANETAFISYYRWYSNDFGGSPNADVFVVEISNNGGTTWVNLETVGPAGAGTSGGWISVEQPIADFIVPTNNMRVRFTASDLGAGSVVEAGVDAVSIDLVSCEQEAVQVVPEAFNVFRGVQLDGTLADTFESDDSRLLFNPGFILNSTEAPVWLVFDAAISSDSPSGLELTAESQAGTPGLTGTLEAFNWSSNDYDVVDVSAASFNTDTVVSVDLSSGISDYVQTGSGAVRSRIGWRRTGFTVIFPWEVRLDQMVWTVN